MLRKFSNVEMSTGFRHELIDELRNAHMRAYRGGVQRIGSATTRFRCEHARSMLSFVYG
jgi:hypothetical protein